MGRRTEEADDTAAGRNPASARVRPPASTASAAPASARAAPTGTLRLRCIGCESLARPLYGAAARSRHVVDVHLLRLGLHDAPRELRTRLQAAIDDAVAADPRPDAIVLAYGLCGGATAGVEARAVPVVLPRAHDCITLLLGGRERYAREFAAVPGTYWYARDWVERSWRGPDAAARRVPGLGAMSDAQLRADRATYVERFGADNADYLMEILGGWEDHYDRAAFIDVDGAGAPGGADAEAVARTEASRRSWRFERIAGDLDLLRRLLAGDWDDDFLVLEPGERLEMSGDDRVMRGARA